MKNNKQKFCVYNFVQCIYKSKIAKMLENVKSPRLQSDYAIL